MKCRQCDKEFLNKEFSLRDFCILELGKTLLLKAKGKKQKAVQLVMKSKEKYPVNEQKDIYANGEETTIENLLTIDELSEWLAIEKSTIYAWTSKKIIPHIKLGKKMLRFRVNEILDWLSEKSVSPNPEVGNQIKKQHRSSVKSSASHDYVDRIIKGVKLDVLRN